MPVQEKIIELETKFSFQEDALAELSDEVALQQRQIAELVREMAALKLQLSELATRDSKNAEAGALELPPHY